MARREGSLVKPPAACRLGAVRRLPSGRYQARYPGPDGVDRPAPQTFTGRTDANVWLTMKEAEIRRADWIDPDAGKILFGDYADSWIGDHLLKPRTEELYRGLLKNHLKPTFGSVDLGKIHEGAVRRWRKERLSAGPRQAHPVRASHGGEGLPAPARHHDDCSRRRRHPQ